VVFARIGEKEPEKNREWRVKRRRGGGQREKRREEKRREEKRRGR
jgi:hypothetical protein